MKWNVKKKIKKKKKTQCNKKKKQKSSLFFLFHLLFWYFSQNYGGGGAMSNWERVSDWFLSQNITNAIISLLFFIMISNKKKGENNLFKSLYPLSLQNFGNEKKKRREEEKE